MPVTITLSETLAEKLQKEAAAQHRSLEEVALDILHNALESADNGVLTPEAVVAKIQATPPDPKQIRPPTESLLEALQNASDDPEFDLEAWNRQWATVEAEMKAMTKANDTAEGRL